MTIKVRSLYYYPIKSCGGIENSRLRVISTGVVNSRQWMVVNSKNHYVAQRASGRDATGIPEMCLISLKADTDRGFFISAPGMDDIYMSVVHSMVSPINVYLRKDTIQAYLVSSNLSQWFTEYLSKYKKDEYKLVWVPPNKGKENRAKTGKAVAFVDQESFHITNIASINDTNSRITNGGPINEIQYRQEIILEGLDPYEEDDIDSFNIGNIRFEFVRLTGRCVIPCINQTTGKKYVEPLKTWATYRRFGKEVVFGIYCLHDGTGEIEIGDSVEDIKFRIQNK